MKDITKKSVQLFILIFLLSFAANAKSFEKDGVIEKEFNINKNTRIEFTNKNSDLQLKVWNKQSVKLECFYKIRANNEEDIEETLDALEDLNVDQSSTLLSIKTGVFSSVNSMVLSGVISKIVATLSSGTVVHLKEFEIEYVLTLPDNHDLMIKQKYSDIDMPDYAGNLELDLYDVDLRAGRLINAHKLKTKYSNLIIGALGNCEADIYDTDVEIEFMGDLNLKSKYSKIEIDELGTITFDSYDDKLYFTALKSIVGKSKYSDIELGNMEFADLSLHDCDLKGKDCGKLKITGKYSGIVLNKVNIFEYPDCYDNKVEVNFVGEFSTDSKYTEFEFGRIAGMLNFDTYDDKLTVEKLDEDFYSVYIKGKYSKIELNMIGRPQYFFDLNFKYTKYDLPSNLLFSNIETKSGKFIASGRTEGLRKSDVINVRTNDAGIRKSNIGKLEIEQYDGTFTINN